VLFRSTPARRRAIEAPHAPAPCAFGWNVWEDDERRALPAALTDPGPCSCGTAGPCGDAAVVWTRQTPLIDVRPEDVVSDDGQEVFNLLAQRGIEDVIVMGVHANVCVLSRAYGIRQLVHAGKRPILCRDLTDAFHRDPRGHDWGTRQVVAHVERRWCPTVTSGQLLA